MSQSINDFVLTDKQLMEFVKVELDFIKNYCADCKPTAFPPILKVLDSRQKLHLISLDVDENFHRSTKRRQVLEEAGTKFYKKYGKNLFPAIVMLSSEAWLKAFNANNMPENIRQPSDYPDAVEVVVVQAITFANTSILESDCPPRASMGTLKIEARNPYLKLSEMSEPNLYPAGPETTDLLDRFFIGWFQEDVRTRN